MAVQLIAAAVMAGISIWQMVDQKKEADRAMEEMKNYEREKVTNPYLGLAKYPSLAYRAAREAADTELATSVAAASRSSRGLSIVPTATDIYDKKMTKIQSDIEKYRLERDKLVAAGERDRQARIAAMENQDIEGLATLYGTAKYNQNEATIGLGNSIVYGADAYGTLYGSNTGSTSNPSFKEITGGQDIDWKSMSWGNG